jgi:Protein of unknown function, DUF547
MKKITSLLFFCAFALSTNAQPNYKTIAPFFKKYISAEGIIEYKTLKKNKSELVNILKKFTDTPPKEDWHRNEKLAYWLNVYNLQMVSMLVENYPTKNIMDLYGGKIWQVKCVEIDGKSYCLDEIEHDIIRKELKEPRIHFALYSGAMSSPALLNDVFTPANMNENFELLAKRFVNSPNNIITSEKAELSQVFQWYKDDFKDIITFINKYSKIKINATTEISYLDFNWNLKDIAAKSKITPTIPTIPAF